MDYRKFDLNLLKMVVAIAQFGTISKAAEKLNVTQPAVSNALARLREITNDPIFIRGAQGQVPTEYGRTLITFGQETLSRLRTCFESRDAFDPTDTRHEFRIAMDDYVESALIPELLKFVAPYADNLSFRLLPFKTLDLANAMEADEIDLSVNSWVDTHHLFKRIRFDELLQDPVCLAVSKDHPIAAQDTITVEEFSELQYCIVRPDHTRYQSPELQLRAMGIRRHLTVQASRANSLPAIAAKSMCAVTIPKMLFADQIRLYDLKTFELPFKFEPVRIVAGHHVRDEKNAAVMWLIQKFKEATETLRTRS